ncbi:BAG family molecular chaperone regulator 5, mitochondrial [Andrographis paniculata]|uniref:BAG family molecular chaperone regulator 5, mitochondrial n=1 Tax=Andrographis paniculata TaxID=175694 RepID=UPI0021E98C07|nr:BAG family molecular chaperone regulator 5, mitochondrial [Andrographis paniculata]
MKSHHRRPRYAASAASAATAVVYAVQSDQPVDEHGSKFTEIPINSTTDWQPPPEPVPVTVRISANSHPRESSAAVKIQSAYRSHVVRILVGKISAVNREANYWQRLIQRQETVDAVRTSQRERIKINEALMGLLFRLDSVPGIDPNVREIRRHVSRKIVGLQEILDAVSDARLDHWEGFLRDWDDVVEGIERDVCNERGGGYEMEKFCAEHLGFQCLQRFLRDQ